jgi:sugar/nucleoside kinase (ribokinase family)
MKKSLQLCGLGNAIVDIFLEVSDAEFASLGFQRGGMQLVELAEQKTLLERYQKHEPKLVSGGSVANSTIAFSQLGGNAGFIGCVGDDRYGLFYTSEFEELGIDIGSPVIVNEATGTCLCVITPDAERTMRTCLAVSSHLAAKHVDEERIKASEWLFIEGYVFANPATGQTAIREALAKTTTAEEAFKQLKGIVPSVVVTNGPHGVYLRHAGVEAHVPAFPSEPKDLTGAGDMLAGAFLYGITHKVPPHKSARAACFLAHKVITQIGARLHHGTKQYWDEALASAK